MADDDSRFRGEPGFHEEPDFRSGGVPEPAPAVGGRSTLCGPRAARVRRLAVPHTQLLAVVLYYAGAHLFFVPGCRARHALPSFFLLPPAPPGDPPLPIAPYCAVRRPGRQN